MFDPEADTGKTGMVPGPVRHSSPGERPEHYGAPEKPMEPDSGTGDRRGDPLDSPAGRETWRRLMSQYQAELEKQGLNRAEMETDHEFYDSFQWSEEDAAVLRDRGQKPIAYNIVATTIDWITGSEKRGRTDFKVLARQNEGSQQAERKTDLLKYVNDTSRAGYAESTAFFDAACAGLGWLEEAVQDEADGEPVYVRYENWRYMLHDSAGTERDLSDARYVFRVKWVDLDIAQSWFPKRKGFLRQAAFNHNQWSSFDYEYGDSPMDSAEKNAEFAGVMAAGEAFGEARPRVRIIEAWFRRPTAAKKMRGGQFSGELFDPTSRGHAAEVESGRAAVVDKTDMTMHCAMMTTTGLLWLGKSPYRHNRFPFTPIWCYRRGKTGLPYGVIRRARDIQEDINWRAAKALAILSSNKVIMEEGAIAGSMAEFQDEVHRPDAIIVTKLGKRLELNVDRDLAPAHIELMSRSIQMIQSLTGVTDENLGRETNASSGKAITARQDQGALATASIFDNLHFAKQVSGEKRLALIEQFFSEQKQFRITNQRGTPQFVTINSGLPEDDITATKADFVITETEWNATTRAAQVEMMMELLGQLAATAPQIALQLLDLAVEDMDVRNKDEMVRRIRSVTGARDPDSIEPTPEEMAKQAKMEHEEEQADRMREAEIRAKEAEGEHRTAGAGKLGADTEKVRVGMTLDAVAAQMQALTAAVQALTAPGAVPVADRILHEAGFKSRTEQEEDAAIDRDAASLEEMAAEGAALQEEAAMQAQPPDAAMPPDPMLPPPGAAPVPGNPLQPA